MNVAAFKRRITQEIFTALSKPGVIVAPGWGFEVTEPQTNTLQVKVTAPAGVIRYYFEVKTVHKVS